MRARTPTALCPLFALLAGCPGPQVPPPPLDAGKPPPDAPFDAPPPLSPSPPALLPCPAGWAERAQAGVTTCEPWASDDAFECAPGEARFPGDAACARLGPPCPEGGVPASLPADVPVVHVRAGATSGDGSAGAPFGTLAEASSAAVSGTLVAIGAGTYDEVLRARAGVDFRGACVAGTTLTSSVPDATVGVVAFSRPGTNALFDLRIADAARPGVTNGAADTTVVLERVAIERATVAAMIAASGRLQARELVVTDTRPAGTSGLAVIVGRGQVTVERGSFERMTTAAVLVAGAGAIALDGVAIRDTLAAPGTGLGGRGAQVQAGGRAELRSSLIERSVGLGILAGPEGTELALEDVVIRDTRAQDDGLLGRAVEATSSLSVRLRRVLLEGAQDQALLLGEPGATLDARDLVIRDTRSRVSDGTRGRGLAVQRGAVADVERVAIVDSRECGLFAGEASVVTGRDVVLRGVLPRACADSSCRSEGLGIGLGAFRDARIELERFVVRDAQLCGLQVALDGGIDLREGQIAGSTIGACVQIDGYDLRRITTRVRYVDNELNLDATMLPIPDAS